jgi:hypothetical protein
MTKREQYNIIFSKIIESDGDVNYLTTTTTEDYFDLAGHLRFSDIDNSKDQLLTINAVLADGGDDIDGLWGEVLGSALYIHGSNNTVEIGDGDTIIPIQDFKELLEEWLDFITPNK